MAAALPKDFGYVSECIGCKHLRKEGLVTSSPLFHVLLEAMVWCNDSPGRLC